MKKKITITKIIYKLKCCIYFKRLYFENRKNLFFFFIQDEIISDKESNFYHEWTKKKEHNINDESHHFPQKVNELKQNLLDTSDNLSGLSEMEFRKGENEEEKEGEKWKDEVFLKENDFFYH